MFCVLCNCSSTAASKHISTSCKFPDITVLQRMPQVEFAMYIAETALKVGNLGQSWSKHWNATMLLSHMHPAAT